MSKFLPIAPRSTYISAELAQESLNLEFLSPVDGVRNLIDLFRNTIPAFKRKLVDVIEGFHPEDDKSHEVSELNKLLNTKRDTLTKTGMVTYGNTLIPVPEGLASEVPMLKYLSFLIDISDTFSKGIHEILTEYKIVLSTFISNKEAKTTIKDHSLFYRTIEKKRLALTKDLSSYFDEKISRSRQALENVYVQGKDIVEAADLTNSLHKTRKRADLEGVKKAVENCANLLDMVIEQSEKGSIENVSGAAATDLANGAMEVARWVELLSIYNFRVDQAITCVKQQIDIVSRFDN